MAPQNHQPNHSANHSGNHQSNHQSNRQPNHQPNRPPDHNAGTIDSRARAALIETRTQEIGRDLFTRVSREMKAFYKSDRWTGGILEWAMRNEAAKLRLFRLIDVLPALEDDRELIQHLREYLGEQGGPFGNLTRAGLTVARLGTLGERATAALLRNGVIGLARRFVIPGSTADAVQAALAARKDGMGFTVDVLGEVCLSEKEADGYQKIYLTLIEDLATQARHWAPLPAVDQAPWGILPAVNVSIKISALYPYLDPICPEKSAEAVKGRLRPILRRARDLGVHVQIDMEEKKFKDLTLRVFTEICTEEEFQGYRHIGLALQAYLRESYEDGQYLVDWARRRGTPVTIRLVKGAYWDYETARARLEGWPVPVFEEKSRTDANFERLTSFLMENSDAVDLAVASHNVRSLARAMAVREALKLSRATLEFQLLHGMAGPLARALATGGERVRIYMPFGELIPGMAYLVRRLLENTANESFLRRGFVDAESVESLMANPAAPAEELPAAAASELPHGGYEEREPGRPFTNCPHADFSEAATRKKMSQALTTVRTRFGGYYPLVIGGREVETRETLRSANPSRPAETVGRVAMGGAVEVDEAVEAARGAFPGWRDRPVQERTAILRRAALLMKERRWELAAWIVFDVGKPWREADADVAEAIDFIEYYCDGALKLFKEERLGGDSGEFNRYLRQGRGVYGIISPWNFPLAILTGMTVAALVTGNTVVMKPAEQASVVGAQLMAILREAGLPPGVANFLPGKGEEAGERLVRHADVCGIAFTGSLEVGSRIYHRASQLQPGARHFKRVIAEMGGKNAIIVDGDADLDEAVLGVIHSAFSYAGQKCSACSRAIVHQSVYERFLKRLVEAVRTLPMGPADQPDTVLGPVIDAEAKQKVLEYIDIGRKEAKEALIRSAPRELEESGGYYVPLAIFRDVQPAGRLAREEIFGPVLAVMPAKDINEAITLAASVDYALTGGVFSRSPENIRRVSEKLNVGNLYINRGITGAKVGRQPFGGRQLSGLGFQAGGPDYLLQFVENRVITENTLRRGFASDRLEEHHWGKE